jgi:hypothetical protein
MLIWEIKRLRGTILRTDQLQRQLGDIGGIQGSVDKSLFEPLLRLILRRLI